VDVNAIYVLKITSDEELAKVKQELHKLKNIQSISVASEVSTISDEINHFKYLQALNLYDTNAKEIPDIFENFKHLKNLTIKKKDDYTEETPSCLEMLPPSFYENCNQLEELSLYNFKNISLEKIFEKNTQIKDALFVNCGIKSIPQNIENATHLDMLYISENELSELPEELFKLQKLTNLTLSKNKITSISSQIASLKALQTLTLDDNPITEIPKEIFTELPHLQIFNLNNGSLKQLIKKEEESLVHSDSIKEIYLANNLLEEFPAFLIQNMKKLSSLYLSDNHIHSFAEVKISPKKMNDIHLNGNKITHFPSFILEGLNKINFFHLSNNQIKFLPDNLYQLAKSKGAEIILKNNQIEHIADDLQKHLSEASKYEQKVNLEGNPILDRLKKERQESHQKMRAEQEQNKTCVEVGDNEYSGSGVVPSEHPLNGRIRFSEKCAKCNSENILITYATFSVHTHSGDAYWDYEYVCQNCNSKHQSSYAEND
jgi:Leucine-rich repeat (LRR) protein